MIYGIWGFKFMLEYLKSTMTEIATKITFFSINQGLKNWLIFCYYYLTFKQILQ